jgi:mRNA interferase RelE/StbE
VNYRIVINSLARRELNKLPKDIRDRILAHIYLLEQNPKPHSAIKMKSQDAYRIRVGDYRVIYTIEDAIKVVTVLQAEHRRKVYR